MKLILGLGFILLFFTSFAQLPVDQFIYINGGFSVGNFGGGQIGINFAVSNKFSFQLEYFGATRSSKSIPSDYGIGIMDIFTLGLSTPHDNVNSFRIMAGKVKNLNQKGTVRINFKGGLSFLTIEEPYNWEKINGLLIVSNYTWDYKTRQQVALVLKPEFEFVFANFMGVTVTPVGEFSGDYSFYGIGINILLGKVRQNLKI